MPSRFAIAIIAASPLIAWGQDDTVALLTQITGDVLVSTGSEMSSATRPIRLAPGTRVLPAANSSAQVVFDDGCTVQVEAMTRYVVDRQPPCHPAVEDDWQPLPSHPALAPYYLVVPDSVMERACGRHQGRYVYGCAVRLASEHACLIYTREQPASWILAHERRHCDGWDHGGTTQ